MIDNMYIPTYDISIHHIHQYSGAHLIHKGNVWKNHANYSSTQIIQAYFMLSNIMLWWILYWTIMQIFREVWISESQIIWATLYIHKYKTNKNWFNACLYGKPDYSVMHKGLLYHEIQYKFPGIVTAVFDKTHTLTVRIDNGTDVSIMPTKAFYIIYPQNHIKIILVLVTVPSKLINLFTCL